MSLLTAECIDAERQNTMECDIAPSQDGDALQERIRQQISKIGEVCQFRESHNLQDPYVSWKVKALRPRLCEDVC